MYVVPDQPGIPDNRKKIIKTEEVVQETCLTVERLLRRHNSFLVDIRMYTDVANAIVDELIEINKVLPVGSIPEKIKPGEEIHGKVQG